MNQKIKGFIFTLFIFAIASIASAQVNSTYFSVGAAINAANYKGDLDDDFTLKFTRPGVGAMAFFHFNPHMAVRITFNQGWMFAKDNNSTDDARKARNLHFRSHITEFSLQLVYEFFGTKRRYVFRPYLSPYVFAGGAVFNYNPKARLNGEWIALQPLGTEGQYLPGQNTDYQTGKKINYPEPYKLTQFSIPFGIGVRYRLTDKLDLRAEIGLRKTFTDYLDDVSGQYPDPQALMAQNPTAALLSDRVDKGVYPEGGKKYFGIRGHSDQEDWYIFSGVSVTYILDWVKCPKFK